MLARSNWASDRQSSTVAGQPTRRFSPVSFTTMPDAQNLNRVRIRADEEEAVVTNPKPKLFPSL